MSIKRKSVISVLLAAAMIFAVGAFTACVEGEGTQSIRVNIRITSPEINEGFEGDMAMLLEGMEKDLTVLAATRKLCVDVLQIELDYDADIGSVKKIGPYISELYLHEYETDEENGEDGEDGANGDANGEEDATEEAVKDHYFDWVCTVNGAEAKLSDAVKEGYTILWEWKEVTKELID